MKYLYSLLVVSLFFQSCSHNEFRRIINLNGIWEFAACPVDSTPYNYEATIPVPGLGDMASITIDSFGYKTITKRNLWYRKKVTISYRKGDEVRIKIHKVKFGHTLYVNGYKAGEANYCFTPAEYEITNYLNPSDEENEIMIRVGAYPDNLDSSVIYGADFEKIRYLSGIYDDVQLFISGNEYINNIQIAPDIANSKIKLAVYMMNDKATRLHYKISDQITGKTLTIGNLSNITWTDNIAAFDIELPHFETWVPENPQLYTCTISSSNDEVTSTFGMRTFGFNAITGRAELNGETYFMRGTNVCIFRFFEDPDRAALPWDTVWVRKLHKKFKSMNWNSIRYCIGFPPRFWYDIADEEGLLIQDEYPIWTGLALNGTPHFNSKYPNVTPESLANEYKTWMQAHWNHPSVVIWDAQNESVTPTTGDAIKLVRHLDLSNRPWENGYATPEQPTDPMEAHPYRFNKYMQKNASRPEHALRELFSEVQIPDNCASDRTPPKDGGIYPNPIIINEYAWLWLNRNGTTTLLTDRVYASCFPNDTTSEQRLETYGKHLGILTEYWRAHRKCAGVLHFCGLGYSRSENPRGHTSDHFIDIQNLTFEPNFEKYVKDAFNPVGAFINYFEKEIKANTKVEIPVIVINDLNKTIDASLTLSWISDKETEALKQDIQLISFDKKDLTFSLNTPSEPGDYRLVLTIRYEQLEIQSIREISILKW